MKNSDTSAETLKPDSHPAIAAGKIGVLLVNLGTPDEPTAPAVRRYLREFLSDIRIVDLPRALWLPILHGIILTVRSHKARGKSTIRISLKNSRK